MGTRGKLELDQVRREELETWEEEPCQDVENTSLAYFNNKNKSVSKPCPDYKAIICYLAPSEFKVSTSFCLVKIRFY